MAGDPDRPEFGESLIKALNRWAEELTKQGRYDEAAGIVERAIDLSPDDVQLYANMAQVLIEAERWSSALAAADTAIKKAPGSAIGFEARGRVLAGADRRDEAVEAFEQALGLEGAHIPSLNSYGRLLFAEGDYDGALELFRQAIEADPNSAPSQNNLGIALAEKLEMAASEEALLKAIELDPDFASAHFNLSMTQLMQGKFYQAWDEYEWRWRCPEFPSTWREFPYPFWDGEPLDGKTILVWSEQGVGDEIMFANTLPDAYEAAGRLVLECNDRFEPLFKRSYPDAQVFVRSDPADPGIEAAGIDYQISMASLCRHFRRHADEFPVSPGYYLKADADKAEACRNRYRTSGPGRIVGISWRSGNPVKGPERSAPLELWDGILTQPGNIFVCLQYGDVADEIAAAESRTGAIIFQDDRVDPFASMDDWFAQVAAMDLVINVDNSTIQVSGSLGIPTWTMLSYVPEWRFMASGENHLWHPHMRLFRPETPGDWPGVMDRVAAELAGL